jgi:hypothetical protein
LEVGDSGISAAAGPGYIIAAGVRWEGILKAIDAFF